MLVAIQVITNKSVVDALLMNEDILFRNAMPKE
jgi:hypothetical protein